MSVNINREVNDLFYRYKMPVMTSKIEGSGNGIKTVLPNIEDVARSLCRPPTYPTKFFGCELGAQTIMDEKNARYIVNGAHDNKRLTDLLDGFIKKFVLCPKCSNPETFFHINRRGDVFLDCKACGARSGVDMGHKLITYILKNPPKDSESGASGSGKDKDSKKKSKEERRKEKSLKAEKERKESNNNSAEEEESSEADSSAKATPKSGSAVSTATSSRANSEQAAAPASTEADSDGDDEISSESLAAAAAYRQQQLALLGEGVRNLLVDDNESAPSRDEDIAQTFANFVETATKGEDIYAEMKRLQFSEDKAAATAVQVIFDKEFIPTLTEGTELLKKFIRTPKMQKGLLGGLERLMMVRHPADSKYILKVLKVWYDEDVLSEETILEWGANPSKKYVSRDQAKEIRAKAKPFLEWLENAEEESDDEEDDE